MVCCSEWMPVFGMLAVNVGFAIMNTLIKKAIAQGMDILVLVTLRQLVATLVMAPIAYFHERKMRPKLTTGIFIHVFFSALLGAALTQSLFLVGLQYVSVTFACAFLNMAPVITFLVALPFGLESLNVKSEAGVAKVVGSVICLGGAMLLTFYKGVVLTNASVAQTNQHHPVVEHHTANWMLGSITLLVATLSWSSWFVLQSIINKKYPAIYTSTALIFFLSFLQAGAWRLATQRDFSRWVVRTKVEIIAVVFAGLVGSGFGFLVMSWCVKKRGPLFTTAFTPLMQIMVAVIDVSILHEILYLGSVLGSVLVIAGLYVLLWGKSKEAQSSAVKQDQESVETPEMSQTA